MLLPSRAEQIYEQVWRPMEQLIGVENLAGLARLDLMRHGDVVARERVYEKHQRQLTPFADDEDAVEERVRDLVLRAAVLQAADRPGRGARTRTPPPGSNVWLAGARRRAIPF